MSVIAQILVALALVLPSRAVGSVLRGSRRSASSNIKLEAQAPLDRSPYRQRLANYKNLQYNGEISIGGQTVPAIFDTGSFDLIVMSKLCRSCPNTIYNSNASKTFRSAIPSVGIQHHFAAGSVTSQLGFDDVKVGPLFSKGQAVYQVTTHQVPMLDRASFDAIVGIGPGFNQVSKQPLLENLHLTEYSICLEASDGAPGWLTWGGELSPEQKTSSAVVLPVIGERHWAVSLTSAKPLASRSEDEKVPTPKKTLCAHGCAAVLDSGTSLIVAPTDAIRTLKQSLPILQRDCSNFDELPDIELVLGGRKMLIPPEAYVVRVRGSPAKPTSAELLQFFDGPGDKCMYAFQEGNHNTVHGPLWILGMPFFRIFHATFRNAPKLKDRRVFLMKAGRDCKPEPLNLEKVPAPENSQLVRPPSLMPNIAVFHAQQQRGPVTIEASDLRPPPNFASFDVL